MDARAGKTLRLKRPIPWQRTVSLVTFVQLQHSEPCLINKQILVWLKRSVIYTVKSMDCSNRKVMNNFCISTGKATRLFSRKKCYDT